MGYILAPEFHKQMWMTLSPFKLAAAPLFALVFGTILYATKSSGWNIEFFSIAAASIFFAIVLLWGCRAAGGAVGEEVTACTWDIPRSSRQTTAQICYGFFLGATAYPWYCALLLFLLCVSALGLNIPYTVVYVVMSALLGQSVAFLFSLALLPPNKPRWVNMANSNNFFSTGMGIMVGFIAFSELPLTVDWRKAEETFLQHTSYWYDYGLDAYSFALSSICFLTFWAFCGSYRVVKRELMFRVMPVAWVIFMATLMVWIAGFTQDITIKAEKLYVERALVTGLTKAFFVALVLCFFTLLVEAGNRAKYARLAHFSRQRDLKRAFENTPLWLATVPFVIVMFMLTILHMSYSYGWLFEQVVCFMLTALLLAVRDGFAVHAIHRAKKTISSLPLLLYFVFIYGLFPFVYYAAFSRGGFMPQDLFISAAALFEQRPLFAQRYFVTSTDFNRELAAMLFFPVKGPFFAVWFAALQAFVAGIALVRVLRRSAPQKETAA